VRAWQGRLIVLAVLLLGAGLRLWRPGLVPPGLYHDEAENGLDALNVLAGDHPLYFEANNGREPLFIYLVSLSVALLGRSPLAIRLPSFFVGFLTLTAAYDMARTLWGRRAGTLTLAILTVTLWHVHLSRVGFRAVLLPLFTALYFSQVTRALRGAAHPRRQASSSTLLDDRGRSHTPRSIAFWPQGAAHWATAGVLYGASWYTYNAARFTPLALAAVLAYGLLMHRGTIRRVWTGIALTGLIALLVLLPLGLFTLAHPDVVLARSGQVSIFSADINRGQFWRTLGEHTLATLGMFAVRGDRIWRHNLAWRPIWDPAIGLAFTVGVGVALAHFRRDAALATALLWTAVMALPTLLAEDAPHFLRGVGVLPTAALLPALGIDWISKQVGVRYSAVARATPLLFVVIGLGSTVHDYFVRYPSEPLAHHWFEAGPARLAGQINTRIGSGWDGAQMLRGTPQSQGHIVIDRELWEGRAALPFLVPATGIELAPASGPVPFNTTFIVWPYRDWSSEILPLLPRPAYLQVRRGPEAQGDLDPSPYSIATLITAAEIPAVPPPAATFEGDIILRAALVQPCAPSFTVLCPSPRLAEPPGNRARSGVLVHLWWETTEPLRGNYTVFVHYLRDGTRIGQHDGEPGFGHLVTSFWQPGDLVLDLHPVLGVQPRAQDDTLLVGLYDPATGEGVQVVSSAVPSHGGSVELPVILFEPED
jgi:4-amino-4-deoxy-L-arabinose transferase-like glycosyltransferase